MKLPWFGLLALAGACRGGDAPSTVAGDVPATSRGTSAVTAESLHAGRVRALYRQAGLGDPTEELLRLPLCRVGVAVGLSAADVRPVQRVACEVPAGQHGRTTLTWVRDTPPEGCSARTFAAVDVRVAGRSVGANEAEARAIDSDTDGFLRWSWDVAEAADAAPSGAMPTPGLPFEMPFATRFSPLCAVGFGADDGFLPGPVEWLVLKGTSGAAVHWLLEFQGPPGLAAVLPGAALAGPRDAGTRHFRPAAVRAAMAWGRDLAFTTLEAGRQTIRAALPAIGAPDITALLPRIRRAHEVFDRQFPNNTPHTDTIVIATPRLPPLAIAADGGLIAIGLPGGDDEPPDFARLIRSGDVPAILDGVLRAHPLRRDSLEFHVLAALAENRLDRAASSAFGAAVLTPGFSGAIALRLIRESGGDKAMRRARELSLVLPFQFNMLRGQGEPILGTQASSESEDTLRFKASLFADALWKSVGDENGWRLVARLAAGEIQDRSSFEAAVLDVAPVPEDARALMAMWLDRAHLADALGSPSVANLLEYVVVDGAIDILKSELLKGAASNPEILGAGVGLLGGGRLQLDPLLDLVEEAAAGEDGASNPWLLKAVDVGRLVLGSDASRQQATDRLVEELGAELGLDDKRRANLKWLAEEAFKAIRTDPAPSRKSDTSAAD